MIVGMTKRPTVTKLLFATDDGGEMEARQVKNINPYLVPSSDVWITPQSSPLSCDLAPMQFGNHPYYGGALIFSRAEARSILSLDPAVAAYVRRLYGSTEIVNAAPRACLWITEKQLEDASKIPALSQRFATVKQHRLAATGDLAAQKLAATPYKFRDQMTAKNQTIVVPRVTSENRPFLPVDLLYGSDIVQDRAFAMYDAPLSNMAFIASRLHWVWIGTVCVRLEMRFSYSNTLGWNTFPVPTLTEQNKADLTRCAEDILLAREAHFPLTIADLYDPGTMPENLRAAHEANDEVLERIYIGRRFRNDTERLEKLFEMYTKMTATPGASTKPAAKRARRATA